MKLGNYRLNSNRPTDVRFTKVSKTAIVYQKTREGEGTINPEVTTVKIDAEPSIDYDNALALLLDFVVDTEDLGSKWTAGIVESVNISWKWNDEAEEWMYKVGVTVRKPMQPDDAIPLSSSHSMNQVSSKELPHEVKEDLERIYDEAWLYLKGKFAGGTQGNLLDAIVDEPEEDELGGDPELVADRELAMV